MIKLASDISLKITQNTTHYFIWHNDFGTWSLCHGKLYGKNTLVAVYNTENEAINAMALLKSQ